MKFFIVTILVFFLITGCKTVTEKVEKASSKETEKLSKFLNKTDSELKIEFGKPDDIEILANKNQIFVYQDSKFKIKCERRFEINQKNIVVAYNSKNCF
tara:strand:- start:1346 stop:1642 length:297 start_codon:yes stop_codon:yes gene_type:complete